MVGGSVEDLSVVQVSVVGGSVKDLSVGRWSVGRWRNCSWVGGRWSVVGGFVIRLFIQEFRPVIYEL